MPDQCISEIMPVSDEARPTSSSHGRDMHTTEGGDDRVESSPRYDKNSSHIIIGVVVVDFVR